MYLFKTSERDDDTVTTINGKFFTKRYGLPTEEITKEWAQRLAWLELNRRGRFEHLIDRSTEIPTLTNEAAQVFMVNNALKNGIN